jgi:hypothetical protein
MAEGLPSRQRPGFHWMLGCLIAALIWFLQPTLRGLQRALALQVVCARRDIPAFSLLTEEDLKEQLSLAPPAGSFGRKREVVQRLTGAALRAGEPVTRTNLVDTAGWGSGLSPAALARHVLLRLPLGTTPPPVAGERVLLLGLKKEAGPAEEITGAAVVLAVDKDQVTLAVPPEQARLTAAYLHADRRLVLLRHLRR